MTTELESPPPIDAATEVALLCEALVAATVNCRIYDVNHPRVRGSMRIAREHILRICEHRASPTLRLGVFDRMMVFDRLPLLGVSLGISRLIDCLGQLGSGGIEFDAEVQDEQLLTFFQALVARDQRERTPQGFNETLVVRECRSVRLLPPYSEGIDEEVDQPMRLGMNLHQQVMELLQDVTVSVCRGGRIEFGPVHEQVEQMLEALEHHSDLHVGLACQSHYDAFTFGHSLRVAILALHFARALTDDRELLLRIGAAALLHDVGKSLIPFELLHAQRQLSEEERREMSRHAELGAQCLLDHDGVDVLAVASAFGHHRSLGGKGYPHTTHQHPVTLVTRIVMICDIFEALTARRPYKAPMSPIRAYRVMIAMGDKLDRRLLRRFIEVNGIYPAGQLVELFDGRMAQVRRQTDDPLRPLVAIVEAEHLEDPLVAEREELLDLQHVECGCARAILRELSSPDVPADK